MHKEFVLYHFTSKRTTHNFSAIPEDQADEQNKKLIKIKGGAIGIFDNHTSLMKWRVEGPEIARAVSTFTHDSKKVEEDLFHHQDTDVHEKLFRRDILSFKSSFDKLENAFEKGNILINVVSKHIMSDSASKSVTVAYDTGKKQ